MEPNPTTESSLLLPPGPPQWWKALIRCNPFYLASALLLVYGIYRASVDPQFFRSDTMQLLFSFSSMQLYGVMLLATAIFLARRKIWYDSALLVFLEHFLVLIPFMLISHAVFLEKGLAWAFCLAGTLLAVCTYSGFKALIPRINLPRELLLVGLFILAVNVAIPLVFRKGLDTENELWTGRSLYCWFLWLPLLALLGNIIPTPMRSQEPREEHEKEWIPVVTHLLWISGTAVHLYTIGYVDEQKFAPNHLSLLLWAVTWFCCAKAIPLFEPVSAHKEKALALPMFLAIPVLATDRPMLFLGATLLNALIYSVVYHRSSISKLTLGYAAISTAMALIAVPDSWFRQFVPGVGKAHLLVALLAFGGIILSLRHHTARWGLLGSFSLFLLFAGALEGSRLAGDVGLQAAIVFYLLHSLSWKTKEPGAAFSIGLAVFCWGAHTIYLQQLTTIKFAAAIPPGASILLLAGVLVAQLLFRREVPLLVLTGLAVLLLTPGLNLALWIKQAPAGVLAVGTSFGLFALGTTYAVLKQKHLVLQETRSD